MILFNKFSIYTFHESRHFSNFVFHLISFTRRRLGAIACPAQMPTFGRKCATHSLIQKIIHYVHLKLGSFI